MRSSLWLSSALVLPASQTDLFFQRVEQGAVHLSDCFDKIGNQRSARMLRLRKETRDQLLGPFGFEFGARHSRCVEERPVGLVALEEPFLVQPIERSHDGGVSERALQLL